MQGIAKKGRKMILKTIPGVKEQFDTAARIIGYGFGPKNTDVICIIMPVRAGVNLGFYRATELPDRDHLLEGTGKLHCHLVCTYFVLVASYLPWGCAHRRNSGISF